jgi:hypothetical protein
MKKLYVLNLGLAFVLFYAGIDQLLHPLDWVGYIPSWALLGQTPEKALLVHSILALLLGLAFLSNIKRRWVGAVGTLFFLSILLANGFGRAVFVVTFRDVAMVTSSLYLAIADEET